MTQKTEMSLLRITINSTFKDLLLNRLSKINNVHIKPLSKTKRKIKEKDPILEQIKQLRQSLNSLFKKLQISAYNFQELKIKKNERTHFIVKDLNELISHTNEEINFYLNRINELDRYIASAKIELENVNFLEQSYQILDKLNIRRDSLTIFNQLEFKIYTTFTKNIENLETLFNFSSIPNIYKTFNISEERLIFFIIYPKDKEQDLIERINLIHAEEIPILKKYLTNEGINFTRFKKELKIIENTLRKYEKEKNQIKDDNLLKFAAIDEIIQNIEEYNWAEHQFEFISSDRISLRFFIPINKKKEVEQNLIKRFKDKIFIESIDIPKDRSISEKNKTDLAKKISKREVELANQKDQLKEKNIKEEDLRNETPTIMKNFFLFRPFEVLTKMYGTPSYSEIDPTPFLFFTFPLLFGLMFGDIGHGLCLIVAGIIGGIFIKKRNIRKMSWIIFYCGWGAVIGGFLYGEFFGSEEFFGTPLEPYIIPFINISLNDPMQNVIIIFKAAIIIGVIQLNLGWFIQFLNYWKQKQKYLAIADSLMKILLLSGGTYLVFTWGFDIYRWMEPPYPILLTLIPGILLIVLKPIGRLIRITYLKKESFGGLMGEGTIDAFETVLSVMSNVASYIRLLALALAHISLLIAIQAMVDLVHGEGVLIEIFRITGLIFGNAVVILIEGLLVFINSVRLTFYEFFSKFFKGSGTEFFPFYMDDNFSEITFQTEAEKDVIFEEIEKEIETKKTKKNVEEAIRFISDKFL
ncbi:MAG: V-type ATP synthase subunit I [Candidatus Hodarchaeota archaeon]